jgi:hypothetical protein
MTKSHFIRPTTCNSHGLPINLFNCTMFHVGNKMFALPLLKQAHQVDCAIELRSGKSASPLHHTKRSISISALAIPMTRTPGPMEMVGDANSRSVHAS